MPIPPKTRLGSIWGGGHPATLKVIIIIIPLLAVSRDHPWRPDVASRATDIGPASGG